MSNFSSFYAATKTKLDNSAVLAAALDPAATQADHVRLERYACISKDGPLNHDAQLALGPNIYQEPDTRTGAVVIGTNISRTRSCIGSRSVELIKINNVTGDHHSDVTR